MAIVSPDPGRLAAEWPGGLTPARLGPDDLDRLCAFHAELHAAAPESGLFVLESRDFFATHLGAGGQIIGLEGRSSALAAYTVLGLPAADAPGNFGHDIGLRGTALAAVCHFDGTGVHPDHRAHGLQRRLTALRWSIGQATGRSIAISAVSPRNLVSLSNMLRAGMQTVAWVGKYGDMRLMLRADAGAVAQSGAQADRAALDLPLSGPPEAHAELMRQGWTGTRLVPGADGPALRYLPARQGGAA
ncbi:MAG: hypothetical protein ACJARE_000858 [Paracoccaceae bacterium]